MVLPRATIGEDHHAPLILAEDLHVDEMDRPPAAERLTVLRALPVSVLDQLLINAVVGAGRREYNFTAPIIRMLRASYRIQSWTSDNTMAPSELPESVRHVPPSRWTGIRRQHFDTFRASCEEGEG